MKEFKDQSWLGLKTRSRDATLSRHKGININELYLHTKIAVTASGETWRGKWQGNEIAAKILGLRECTPRISRDFNEQYPKLRSATVSSRVRTFLSSDLLLQDFLPPERVARHRVLQLPAQPGGHLPVHAGRLPPQPAAPGDPAARILSGEILIILFPQGAGIVVDTGRAIQFAIDIAKGMAFLHSLDRQMPRLHLTSRHVMVDCVSEEELVARVNMADAKFTFQEKGKLYQPAWSVDIYKMSSAIQSEGLLTCLRVF